MRASKRAARARVIWAQRDKGEDMEEGHERGARHLSNRRAIYMMDENLNPSEPHAGYTTIVDPVFH